MHSSGCTSLKSVTIGGSVRLSIGASAFSGCERSDERDDPRQCHAGIGSETFYECTSLKSVTIGGSVTSIVSECFRIQWSDERNDPRQCYQHWGEWAFYELQKSDERDDSRQRHQHWK